MRWFLPLLTVTAPLMADEQTIAEMVQNPESNLMQTLVLIAIMAAFFYFVMYRPEKKRRALLEGQRAAMKLGDRVVAVGIVGTVDRIDEKTVILRMVDGGKIEVLKAAITEVIATPDA